MADRPRLTRSKDRVLAGVCGGIAEFLGWSPIAVRALYLFVSIVSAAFPGIIAYLVLWWVMPEADGESGFRLDDFRRQ
ncbi:MAG TPA: PspC domain-containing protein [Gemmatimonadaceae bacterium]